MKGQRKGSIKSSSNYSWHCPAQELIWFPLRNAEYYSTVEDIQCFPSGEHRFTSASVKAAWSRPWGELEHMKVGRNGCLSHWVVKLWDNRRLGSEKASTSARDVEQSEPAGVDASVPKQGCKAPCHLLPAALEASPTQQPGFSMWGSSLSLAGLVIWKLNNLFDEFLIFSNKIFTNNCFHYLSRPI